MTGLSDFLKVLETYFLTKLAQILGKILWYSKTSIFCKKLLLLLFGENWATFIQASGHTV